MVPTEGTKHTIRAATKATADLERLEGLRGRRPLC